MTAPLVDTGIVIRPDPTRVLGRFFVPGREDLAPGASRAGGVVDRVLALDEAAVERAMSDVDSRCGRHHRAFDEMLRDHAARVLSRVDPESDLSDARLRLLGATFTREDSIEGAALCNPSIVLHPHQPAGSGADFILSVRGIGEGHRSSIGFRTGSVTDDGVVSMHTPGPYPEVPNQYHGLHHRSVFRALFAEQGDDPENVSFILDEMVEEFGDDELESQISLLMADDASRSHTANTVAQLRELAGSGYSATFSEATHLSERVLWPHAPSESNGLEDARFVRFVGTSGRVTYFGTYTAFDGQHIAQQILDTKDFRTFRSSPIIGAAAVTKGLALFPRRVNGRFVALTRSDRESNEVAFSDDLRAWPDHQSIQVPERSWEMVQLGNCGSPVETEAGWLVITHGVGPMRTYSLGALLLDIDDPTRVIASTDEPILVPSGERGFGYVPNVVYTCGAMAHGDVLVVPYGMADQSIAIATGSIRSIIAGMRLH